MNNLNNKKYWLMGGMIAAILFFVYGYATTFLAPGSSNPSTLVKIVFYPSTIIGELLHLSGSVVLRSYGLLFIDTLVYFVIGMFIGWIYGNLSKNLKIIFILIILLLIGVAIYYLFNDILVSEPYLPYEPMPNGPILNN